MLKAISKGLDFVRLGAKSTTMWIMLAVLVTTNSCSYMMGKKNEQTAEAERKTVIAEKKTAALVTEVKARTPVAMKKQEAAVKAQTRVADAAKELYYAEPNRTTNPVCDISDAELDAYGVLADEINAAAGRNDLRDNSVR